MNGKSEKRKSMEVFPTWTPAAPPSSFILSSSNWVGRSSVEAALSCSPLKVGFDPIRREHRISLGMRSGCEDTFRRHHRCSQYPQWSQSGG
jgi:hypothetical protein